ncbi:MAG: hypothetical protein H0T53_13055 [Herpetosiphonaceae bacterium]|nr:hypothetical protein [Herpetosiphonaceae bacterium]
MPVEPSTDRYLGPAERLNLFNEAPLVANIVVFGEVSGPLLDYLPAGLAALQARHPLLNMRVVQQPDSARFTPQSSPLTIRVVDGDPSIVTSELDRELNEPFSADGPLARCAVVRHAPDRATLIVCVHHSLGDGIASTALIRDLLQAVAQASQGQAIDLPRLPLRPSVEAYLPATLRGWRIYPSIVRMLARQHFKKSTSLPYASENGQQPLRIACKTYRLEQEETRLLVAQARRNGTTVQGALCAALFLAIESELGPEGVPQSCVVPVDLHARVEPTIGEELLLFNAPVTVYYPKREQRSFWSVASEATSNLALGIARNEHFASLFLTRFVTSLLARQMAGPDGNKAMQDMAAKTRAALRAPTFLLSNLGSLKIDHSYGPLSLHSFGFIGSLFFTTDLGCCISTLNDVLVWNYVWKEPRMCRNQIDRIASRALELVRQALALQQ